MHACAAGVCVSSLFLLLHSLHACHCRLLGLQRHFAREELQINRYALWTRRYVRRSAFHFSHSAFFILHLFLKKVFFVLSLNNEKAKQIDTSGSGIVSINWREKSFFFEHVADLTENVTVQAVWPLWVWCVLKMKMKRIQCRAIWIWNLPFKNQMILGRSPSDDTKTNKVSPVSLGHVLC